MCAVAAGMASALQGACVTFPSRALTQWEKEPNPEIRMSLEEVSWFGKFFRLSIPLQLSDLSLIMSEEGGGGGGLAVSEFTFYSDNLSSNSAETFCFF